MNREGRDQTSWCKRVADWITRKPDRFVELTMAFAIVCFSGVQLWTTIRNNQGTGQQTDQLIQTAQLNAYAADESAKAARSFADSANLIRRGVDDAVEKLQAQAAASQNIAEISNDSAQTAHLAITDNRAASARELRPYLYAGPITTDGDRVGNDELLTASLNVVNSGRTPAHEVRVCITFALWPAARRVSDDDVCPLPGTPLDIRFLQSRSVVGPAYPFPYTSAKFLIQTPEPGTWIRSVLARKDYGLWVYGDIFYEDPAQPGQLFRTSFCGHLDTQGSTDARLWAFIYCEQHNKIRD